MSRTYFWPVVVLLGLTDAMVAMAQNPVDPSLKIVLPGVEGRMDHLAVDLKSQRLFVAALGNNTVEVIDLAEGKCVQSISGVPEPQGITYIANLDRIVVACGRDGSCRIFDGRTYRQTAMIDCQGDADNVRYDPVTKELYVGCGDGGLTVIDVERAQKMAVISLAGHPESFQLDPARRRIFVNVPTARQVAVVDQGTRAVVATWPVTDAEAHFPMALTETQLLIGCRKPARLLAIDIETGKTVAAVPCVGDTDDLFYDAEQRQVYVSGGEGLISVIARSGPNEYRPVKTIPTSTGARTSLFVPANSSLYVAVPHQGAQKAEIWVYQFGKR